MSATESPAAAPAPAPAPEASSPEAAPAPPPAVSSPPPATTPASSNGASTPTTSLYVGELDPSVTEAMLYEIFNSIGPVASIRVCRDAVTRRSLGYAYVNYVNGSDGERALDQLNYSFIKGKACRIMYSQRDPALRKTGQGNIFIKNLDETIDNKALHDTFAAFGSILSSKVVTDENGNSKGYGFVHYDSAEGANEAIKNVNGMLLNDKVVFVGHHVPRRERQAKIDEIKSKFTNLYIKDLNTDVTDEQFRELFAKFGDITSALVSREADGKSKGFGFVNFENHEDAKKAVDELHETDFHGQKLYVSRAQKKSERTEELKKSHEQARYEQAIATRGVNLYVKNVDDEMDDEKLKTHFSPFGTITSCKIMRDEKGVSKGFGFVCFSAPDEATKAVTELNGKMIANKPLYVAIAQSKEARKSAIEASLTSRNRMMQYAGFPPYGAAPFQQPPGPFPGMGRAGPGPVAAQRGPTRYAPMGPMGMPGMQQFPPYGQPMGAYDPRFAGQFPGMQPGGMRNGMPGPPGRAGAAGPNGYPMMGPNGPIDQGRNGLPMNPNMIPPMGQGLPGQAPVNGIPRPPPAGPPGAKRGPPRAQDPAEMRQAFGEALYPAIQTMIGEEQAGKVTGMLLELSPKELSELTAGDPESEEKLRAKVDEAIQVLRDANKIPTEE